MTPHLVFVLSVFATIGFQFHYHAHEVLNTVVYHHTQLFDYHPLVRTHKGNWQRTERFHFHKVFIFLLILIIYYIHI